MSLRDSNSKLKALFLGGFCSLVYLTSYIYKYLLSNFESILIEKENGVFTAQNIAVLSTVYLVFYACGQLINGFLGDRLKPKYMVGLGFLLASLSLGAFPFLAVRSLLFVRIISYAVLGFSLSMLRSPFTKIMTENLTPGKARVCCATMNAAAVFFGSAIAAFSTTFFASWRGAYRGSCILAFATLIISFVVIVIFEKTGMVVPIEKPAEEREKRKGLNLKELFGFENFTMYLLVAVVVEALSTAVLFLIPTFFKDCLGYGEATSAVFMTVISVIRGVFPYITIIIYRFFPNKDNILLRISYIITMGMFGALIYTCSDTGMRFLSVLLVFIAFCGSEFSTNMLWSIYIPGLGRTGRVSSATGILDCVGYGGAALFNMQLGKIVSKNIKSVTLWKYEIAAWCALSFVGIAVTFVRTKSVHKE